MMTAALAAMLAASPMALAAPQTAASSDSTGANAAGAVTATHLDPGQIIATDLKGADIYDQQKQKVATVKDIVLDRIGRVAAVVLDVNGKNVAVAMQDLHFAMNDDGSVKRITIDQSKDQLGSAEAFRLKAAGEGSGGSAPAGSTTK
jgi:sporulation protein YlmC with PRC-barrel domain